MPVTFGSPRTLVNTTTADYQQLPTVADLPGIGYVVTWQGPGYNPTYPLESGLYGQCYTYAGEKIGGEFVVSNNFGSGFKSEPDVIGGPNGTFTVTWTSIDNSGAGIFMKTLYVGGGVAAAETQVNTVTTGSEELSQVTRLANGNFIVTWQGTGNNPGETGVFARLYNPDHQAIGGQFQVNGAPTSFGSAPSVTADISGGFVVACSGVANGSTDIFLQRFGINGEKAGSEINLTADVEGAQRRPVLATLSNGTYVVAWDVGAPGLGSSEVVAQRFGLNGEKIGPEFLVSDGVAAGASNATIVATPGGGFAISFQAGGQIMLRSYTDYGPLGDAWPIAEGDPALQLRPDMAPLGDGSFITTWHNGDVYAERFYIADYLTEGADLAMGTSQSDFLEGFGGDDTLRGGEGDDILEGGLGADRLIGGAGRDEVTYMDATSGVSLNLLTGGHSGEAQGDRFEEIEQFSLSRFADRFIGGDANDIVYGLAGDDNLSGGKGTDYLDGGDGNDLLEGGGDAGDVLNGGEGFDEVTYIHDNFGLGIDLALGYAAGAAFGDAFYSIEKFTLSRFNDSFAGDDAVDRVAGGFGDDGIYGRGGDDVLDGNDGNDLLNGGAGADLLAGGSGNDTLDGGSGADVMTGGMGNDVYMIDQAGDVAAEGVGGGRDVVYAGVSYMLAAGAEIEVLSTISQSAATAIDLVGNGLDQEIYGNAGANMLQGGGGSDWLFGLGGSDIYVVTGAGDHIVEQADGGSRDVAYALASYTLEAGVAIEVLSAADQAGTAPLALVGNAPDQEIYGNAGGNQLEGGGGSDFLIGLGGNDVYFIDSADDQVVESAGGGRDVVYAQSSYTLAAGQEVEVLTAASSLASTALDLTGNDFANELYGNAGANLLNGGGGADYLQGFGGADNFAFTTALGGGNVDTIADFVAGTDRLLLDDAVFAQLGGPGTLNGNAFVTGAAAADASDRIVYDSATGQLFYDADGSGAGAAVLFATLATGLNLAASDFIVI